MQTMHHAAARQNCFYVMMTRVLMVWIVIVEFGLSEAHCGGFSKSCENSYFKACSSDVRRRWAEVQLMPCRWIWTTIPWYRWENLEWSMIIASLMWVGLSRLESRALCLFHSFIFFTSYIDSSTRVNFRHKSGVIASSGAAAKHKYVSLVVVFGLGVSAGCAGFASPKQAYTNTANQMDILNLLLL